MEYGFSQWNIYCDSHSAPGKVFAKKKEKKEKKKTTCTKALRCSGDLMKIFETFEIYQPYFCKISNNYCHSSSFREFSLAWYWHKSTCRYVTVESSNTIERRGLSRWRKRIKYHPSEKTMSGAFVRQCVRLNFVMYRISAHHRMRKSADGARYFLFERYRLLWSSGDPTRRDILVISLNSNATLSLIKVTHHLAHTTKRHTFNCVIQMS